MARDLPGGPGVKNLQVQSLVKELGSHMQQGYWAHVPQLESPQAATKSQHATTKIWLSKNIFF